MSSAHDKIEWSARGAAERPGDGEVHLWRVRLDAYEGRQDLLRRLLTRDECERADRFRFDIHRGRYLVSRAVLRTLLSRYLGRPEMQIALGSSSHGKPELLDSRHNLQFNLSHAGDLAVYAFAHGRRVGVDVEDTERDASFRDLAVRFFAPDEQRVIEAVSDGDLRETFYQCWTRKEAYIKALGLGVTHGLDNFSVAIGPGVAPALLHSDVDRDAAMHWMMRSFEPAPGFIGALAAEGRDWHLFAYDVGPED